MENSPHIIELIGPSGSGKSTFVTKGLAYSRDFDNVEIAAFRGLIHHKGIAVPGVTLLRLLPVWLARRLRLTKIVAFYHDQIIRAFGTTYRNLLTHVHESICKLPVPAEEKFWLSDRILEAVVNHHLITQPVNNGRKILADEFFLQKIFSLNIKDEHIPAFLQNLNYKIDVLLKFNEEAQTCLSRLRLRDRNRNPGIRNMSDENLLQKIKSSQYTTNLISNTLKNNGVRIIEVNGDTNERDVVDIINKI